MTLQALGSDMNTKERSQVLLGLAKEEPCKIKDGRDVSTYPETPSLKTNTQRREEKPLALAHWMPSQHILQVVIAGRGQGIFFFFVVYLAHFRSQTVAHKPAGLCNTNSF